MLKTLTNEHFPLCQGMYSKSWDRPLPVKEFASIMDQNNAVGSVCFDSRGYSRAFLLACVTPKITSVGHIAIVSPGFAEELLGPVIVNCNTPVQLVVPDAIYDQPELTQELKEIGFLASGVIHDEVDGDLIKFTWRPKV